MWRVTCGPQMEEATLAMIRSTRPDGRIQCPRHDCTDLLKSVKAVALHLHIHDIHDRCAYLFSIYTSIYPPLNHSTTSSHTPAIHIYSGSIHPSKRPRSSPLHRVLHRAYTFCSSRACSPRVLTHPPYDASQVKPQRVPMRCVWRNLRISARTAHA